MGCVDSMPTRVVAWLAAALLLCACQPPHGDQRPGAAASANAATSAASSARAHGAEAERGYPRSHLLTIYGYNYSNRYIDSWRVNGQGGGNLFLSTPHAGGGSGVCCVSWWSGTKLPKTVRIDWVGAYCKQRSTNPFGEVETYTQPLWRTAYARIEGPVPPEPRYFEAHIYPDGHVEVALTTTPSPPRLLLPEGDGRVRPGTTANDPPCPEGYDRLQEYMKLDDPALNKPPAEKLHE